MKSIVLLVLLITGFVRCMNSFTPQAAQNTTDDLTISSGTSFGMCTGYCQNDYTFNGTSVTLVQSSVRPQTTLTSKSCQSTISQSDWNTLKAAANVDLFSKQPKLIGCPDCTDAGSEYVEIQAGPQKYRVTFPFGRTIPGFESLVDALRNQREAFKNCN